jgi:myo-inositol 2-dehydrogenase/D-chiro-inositol 1-dehydrogenase
MTLRVCTVGCGGIATGRHGPSYARYAAERTDTDLVACCDLIEERARAFAERFGFLGCYTDLVGMLEAERPDAVCLVSPVDLTCELACRILSMGYPLMMEKPPGKTIEETDRLIAAADASGAPSQVAFNRRHAPLIRAMREQMDGLADDDPVQHVTYEVTRVNRRDPDFSTTAIHGIDAVRTIAAADYAHVRYRYHEMPELGPGVCNIFMDCVMQSGATAHLAFCPMAGSVIERATVHAHDHTWYMHLPTTGLDGTGLLRHVEKGRIAGEQTGPQLSGTDEEFVLEGFYGENASFFDDIRAGRRPVDDLRSTRQSVEVAQCIRERRGEYKSL